MKFLNRGSIHFDFKEWIQNWLNSFFMISLDQTTPRLFHKTNGVVFNIGSILLSMA